VRRKGLEAGSIEQTTPAERKEEGWEVPVTLKGVLRHALAKAELRVDEEIAAEQFLFQREQVWSPELAIALRNLSNRVQPPDEPEEGNKVAAA